MKKVFGAATAVLSVFLFVAIPGRGVPAARACEGEGAGLISVRLKAPLAPEDAAKIVFEQYNGTLTIKGITLSGTAVWSDNEVTLLEGPVKVVGVILTTGDETTYLDNRGILWLKYRFLDPDGVTPIGSGEGFVTLERVGDTGGEGSFQGSVTIGGVAKQFAGTGDCEVVALTPLPPTPPAGVACDDEEDEDDLPGLFQEMAKTVITGDKPGFEFESSLTAGNLNAQFVNATKRLTRQRNARLQVIRAVR
jgi:hypothetical protein